ncbi:putative mfs monocarboxylate protein [Botrytis fragariae]|uniref:Putative mfs monocarboxylate protein n=1 Tax=Botrytis fragariae TaxID=1964551 RepID=A0A8H6EDJ5_9HELO|nr:putative mfs monocarboxylate protein [Botrytis fragariae]KAF5867960.1 putative mfs monocarboxylate protein [Botrytis fragariae]
MPQPMGSSSVATRYNAESPKSPIFSDSKVTCSEPPSFITLLEFFKSTMREICSPINLHRIFHGLDLLMFFCMFGGTFIAGYLNDKYDPKVRKLNPP